MFVCLFFSVSLGTLSSIPTALTRWTDECKVLDAESMHDCVAGRFIQVLGMGGVHVFNGGEFDNFIIINC